MKVFLGEMKSTSNIIHDVDAKFGVPDPKQTKAQSDKLWNLTWRLRPWGLLHFLYANMELGPEGKIIKPSHTFPCR